jgi:hypothetical protein
MVWFRGIVAVLAGVLIGGAVNMGLIISGSSVIPAPEGVDVTQAESIAANIHLFEPKHFLFPFLAHALGTLAGAVLAALVAPSHGMRFALGIGVVFLAGGIANTFMIPAPAWFIGVDLLLAYLPAGYLGGLIALKFRPAV